MVFVNFAERKMTLKKNRSSPGDHQGIVQKAGKSDLYSFLLPFDMFIVKGGRNTYGQVDSVKSRSSELQDMKLSSEAAIPSPAPLFVHAAPSLH